MYKFCAPLPTVTMVITCPFAANYCGKLSTEEWKRIASNLPQCVPPKCIENIKVDPKFISFAMSHPELFNKA
jgi:hypothetical protein